MAVYNNTFIQILDFFLNRCYIPLFAVEGGLFADFELVVDEYVNMLGAAGDTTANTLEFVFMELGRHPDVCQRQDEFKTFFCFVHTRSSDRPI